MKKTLKYGVGALALAMMLTLSASAAAPTTAPGQNKLLCFDGTTDGGYGGNCTLMGKGAKGPATLDNSDGNVNGSYSGVYVEASKMYNTLLSDTTQLSFSYTGDATAGSPRYSIPVDTNADTVSDGYLFVSALYCNDGAGYVDVVNDETCTIYTNFSSESFDNWADLVATYPTWSIANDAYIFIIADDAGVWTVSGVKFGKAGK
jgi:hypothetical protein